jgi:hypothetical protein
MLIWGSKGEIADLGVQAHHNCTTCERERPFKLALQYKVHHIWYLFKWVTQKQYLLVCDVCQRGSKLDAKEVEPKLAKHPIPLLSRYGWTLLIALIVAVLAFTSLESSERASKTEQLMSAPRANDIYVLNVASLLKSPEASSMYGVMRVRSVQGGNVEFEIPSVTYNKVSGPTKDIRNGKLSEAGYFTPQTLTLPAAELERLKKDGAIHSVERN